MNIKDAIWHTAHDYEGGFDALAVRMGMKSAQVLRNKVNPNCDSHHLHFDQAVSMMILTGDYRIAEAMAGELGCVFAPMPHGEVTTESILGLLLSATAKNGDICQVFHQALADGVIDANEEETILAMIDGLSSTLFQFRRSIVEYTTKANA